MKVYDSIERSKLHEAMQTLNIPKKLIKLTKMTLTDTPNKVVTEGKILHTGCTQTGGRSIINGII